MGPNGARGILAIDPGNDAGWSFWTPEGLGSCGLGPPPIPCIREAGVLAIEFPMVYPDEQRVDPNRLIVLAMNAGRHVERVLTHNTRVKVYGFRPRTWKGAQAKVVHHDHLRRAMAKVDEALACSCMAKVPESKKHNVWDAVALGKWALARVNTDSLAHMSDYKFGDL